MEAGVAHGDGRGGIHFRRERKDDLPLTLRGLVGCASVLYGDLDDVEIIQVDTERLQVSMSYIDDFDAKLPLIVRSSRVDLRKQSITNKAFDAGSQRVFLARSAYASDDRDRLERKSIEARIRGCLDWTMPS